MSDTPAAKGPAGADHTDAPQRVRFSPAPTGSLHLGGARTALFNWLVARASGGTFIVRIEDTDADRCDADCEAGIAEDLAWLGLDQDEGPQAGGPHAPYRQSERADAGIYGDALGRLKSSRAVYPCFCTTDELEASRSADETEGRAPRYGGGCRDLSQDEARARLDAGEQAAWRFRVEQGDPVEFHDAVHGPMRFERGDIGDFVVARSDGTAVYDLAAAVDDVAMGITLVLRGDDHLSNTPRQILLIGALGAQPPSYAHVPLIHGADGRPLSKSRGAAGIAELRDRGYLPEAVMNHLAQLGWSDPGHRDVLTREQLVESFTLGRVSRSPAASDEARLTWLDEQHIRALAPERFLRELAPVLPRPLPEWFDVRAFAAGVQGEVSTLGDAAALARPLLEPDTLDAQAAAMLGSSSGRVAAAIATAAFDAGLSHGAEVVSAVKRDLVDSGVPAREALPAIRAALTGRAHGLPLALVLDVLGPLESRKRLLETSM